MNDFRKLFEQTSAVETQSEGTSFRAKFDQAQAMSNAGDINGIMSLVSANISDPEEAQAVAGMTYTLAKTYNQKPIDILKDLDGWAARYNGATQPRKTAWKQIQDGFVSGWYTDQLGTIGSALMNDQKPEIRQMYLDRIAEIKARMPNPEGDKGNIGVKALSSASNLVGTMVRPFLTNLAVSSLIPAIKLPMVATELAGAVPAIAKKVASQAVSFGTTWAVTADVEAGNIYIDMLDNGVDEDIAKKYARIHGAIAGALEAAPLEFAFTRFPFLKGATQSAWKKLATNTRTKQALVKTLGGILQKNLISAPMQVLAETATEALQEVSSISFERKAALALADEVKDEKLKKMLPEVYNEWRDLYNKEVGDRQALYEGKDYKEYVADRVWDVVVQTALGTSVLGFAGAAGQVISDARYTSTLRKEAEVDPSKFHFIKKHFTDDQMKDIKPGERKETLAQIYDTHHAGEATVDNINPKTIDADYVPINEDVEDEEQAQASSTPTQPIKRRKDNRLHTQEMIGNEKNPGVIRHSDGSETHTLLLGTTDTSARKNNRYGYIDYTISADGRSVKLDSVNMKPGYEDLTGEFVTELMRRYPGLEIEWSPETDSQKAIKEQLIKGNTDNPGKLQMFKRDQSDMDRILKVAGYIKEIAPKMDSDKAAVFAEVLDIRARRRGVSLDEYLGHYLKFMSVEQGIKEGRFTEQELKDIKGKKGAFKPMIDAVEGIVFVGEEGDFSTFAHETWHGAVVADPESAKEFADAIKNGIAKNQKGFRKYLSDHATIMAGSGVLTPNNKLDIDRAISELSNMDADPTKWNTAQNELSARLFETALQEGRTFDPEMKSIMDKIVDFFLKIYRLLKQRSMLNDDIVKAMDKIFLGNPELKAKAEATQTQRQETSFQDTTPEERAEAERQYNEVVAKYKGTDQWLKAPNGKPTNLTERQWVQVRTPAFKAWFGDWENDPDNASKVVDKNGEPLVVYHGTKKRNNFDVFDPYYYRTGGAKKNKGINLYGDGFYFAEDYFEAQQYGSKVYEVFLNIKNPAPNDNLLTEENDGIRGSIPFGGTVYVAYQPNQIKSATDNVGTFSQSNPSILFQTAVDLTQDFADISNGKLTEQNIETHINSLIGQVIDTATEPLQIQITQDNKAHVITTNVKLKGNQKRRHNVALNKIEKIINNAREVNTSPTDMTHNTSPKTLEHKQNVVEYVYFDSPIRIGTDLYNVELATERMKGQDPDVLDLYNVHVKKTPAAAHLSTLQTEGFNYNNTTSDENVNPHTNLLFQSAYHGSGASFDKFDTDFMGTGEGAQAFGWGIYFTQSEGIARSYAEANNRNFFEASVRNQIKDYIENNGWDFDKAKAELIDDNMYLRRSENEQIKEDANTRLDILRNIKTIDDVYNYNANRNLYTVTIPDDTGSNYLYWDKELTKEQIDNIKTLLKAVAENPDNATKKRLINAIDHALDPTFNEWDSFHVNLFRKGRIFGESMYKVLEDIFKSPKAASEFLNRAGFVGIDYPANSMSGGNKYGKRNFVIFNADDITIDTHTMWQEKTPQEIENEQIAEAKGQTLDDWLDYNRFMGDEDIDEEALKAIWEKANNVTETPEGTKIVNTENLTEEEKDNAFQAIIDSEDGVRRVIEDIRQAIQLKDEVYRTGASDDNEQSRAEAIDKAQADLETTAAKIIKSVVFSKEKEIDEQAVKSIQGIMRKNLAEYRELYSKFTGREELAMSNDALPFIDEPTRAAIATMTISQKRKYLEEVADEKLTESFLKGKELREGETERVIKHLKEKMADKDKDIAEAQEELKNATKRISSRDQMLLKEVGKREELENQVNKLSAKIRAKLDKGNKISEEEYRKLNTAQEKLDNINEMLKELRKQDKAKEALRWSEKIAKATAERKETERRLRAAQKLSDYKKNLVDNITRKIPKTVNWEQAEKIQAIQAVFGRPSQYDNEYITYKGKKMLLKEFKAGIEDGSINVEELSDYQLRRYLNKDIAEYSVEELEIMADTVRYLIQTGRQAWQAKIDARNYEAKQWQSLIMNQIARSPRYTNASDTPLPGTAEDIKKERNLLQMIRTGWFKTLNMARKAQMLDGDRKAVAYRLLVEEYRDHLRNELEAIRRRQKPVQDLMEKLGVKPEDFYNDTYRLNIGGHEQTYNLSQIIYGVKAQMEQRNMEAFVYGNLFNANEKPEGVNRLWLEKQGETRLAEFNRQAQEILKGKENIMKVADAIWADWQNRDNFNRLNQAAIDEYNQAVDPVAFYMPIARLDFNGTELASKIADDLYNQNAGKGMTSVEKGMIKSRITIAPENQMPIDMDYFKLWNESVNDQEHFIETNAYIRKLNRVFKARGSKDLKATIENVFGQGMMNDINNYINEIANPDINTDTQGVNKFITFLRGALYPAYLAFKASSVILQMITSPAPFLREVGPLELVKGLVQMSLHPVETWRYVSGLSAIMENRSMNPMVEEAKKAAQRYTDPKYMRLWHKIQEKVTMGLEMADKWSVTAGWLAVFTKQKDKLIAEGMEEAQAEREAVKYADNVVLETQPTGDKAELAPLFKVGGPAWQAFTQFQVSLNVIWNNLSYDVLFSDRINHEKRKAMGTLIGYAMAGMILYATQEGFDDDDDAEDVILKLLYGATTQYTSSIPLVSSSIDNMIRARMTGENWISKSNQLYPGFDALMQGVTNLDWNKVVRGAAIMGGVPISGWKEFEHSFYNRKTGELRFYPQAFLGRRETNKKK